MIATLREWFSPRDPLVRSQIMLVALTAVGFIDYFNDVFIYALEIPIALLIAMLCFGRGPRIIGRCLVELLKQSALLCVLLFMIFIALQRKDRGYLSDLPWRSLLEPLLAGMAYYCLHFVPPLRSAWRTDNPIFEWYRTVIVPQFALWFVLLVAAFGAFALHFMLDNVSDSTISRLLATTALMALTAFVRILFTRALGKASNRIEAGYVEFLGAEGPNNRR